MKKVRFASAAIFLLLVYAVQMAMPQDNPFVQFNVSGIFLNSPNEHLSGWFILNKNNGRLVKADLFHGRTELPSLVEATAYPPDSFLVKLTNPARDLLFLGLWAPENEGSLEDYTGGVLCPVPGCMSGGTNFVAFPYSHENSDDLRYGDVTDVGPVPLLTISIKPGSAPPVTINPRSHGLTTVAIISTRQFDATTDVDTRSLTFGTSGAEQSLAFCDKEAEDINGDRLPDLVCHFYTRSTQFLPSDVAGFLLGKTITGSPFVGIEKVLLKPLGR